MQSVCPIRLWNMKYEIGVFLQGSIPKVRETTKDEKAYQKKYHNEALS